MYTYCLFCGAGKNEDVALLAKALFSCRTIIPKHIQPVWDKKLKQMSNRVQELFPGYVFLYSEEKLDVTRIQQVGTIIRWIHGGSDSCELTGSDQAFAQFMLEKEGFLGKTLVCMNQETMRLYFPPEMFHGADVSIQRVVKRNHKMEIAIRLLGETVHIWVEYEIVPEEAFQDRTIPGKT